MKCKHRKEAVSLKIKSILKKTIIAVALTQLMSCATSYQSQGYSGGYSETWLAEDLVEVSFNGNGYTSSTRVRDFAMLRAAELGFRKGYNFFTVVDKKNSSQTGSFSTRGRATTTTTFIGNTAYSDTSYSSPVRIPVTWASTDIAVRFSKEKRDNSLDTRYIIRSISRKYRVSFDR